MPRWKAIVEWVVKREVEVEADHECEALDKLYVEDIHGSIKVTEVKVYDLECLDE